MLSRMAGSGTKRPRHAVRDEGVNFQGSGRGALARRLASRRVRDAPRGGMHGNQVRAGQLCARAKRLNGAGEVAEGKGHEGDAGDNPEELRARKVGERVGKSDRGQSRTGEAGGDKSEKNLGGLHGSESVD